MSKVLIGLLLLTSCTSDLNKVNGILETQGCSNIRLAGHSWFGCGKDDFFSNGFSCKINSRQVEGVVCCGILKGCTVRYE